MNKPPREKPETKRHTVISTAETKRQGTPAPISSEISPPWDLAKALQLRFQGISHNDIAKYFGIPKSTLQARIKPFCGVADETQAFKSHRADILAAQQARVLLALSDSDLKKASARDKAIVFGTFYDKERLERGLSTQNSAVILASAVIMADEIASKRAKDVTETVTEAVVIDSEPKGNA